MPPLKSFNDVLRDALADIKERGFESGEQILYWQERLEKAAEAELTPPHVTAERLKTWLQTIYDRLVTRKGVMQKHPGIPLYTLERLRPQLQAELNKRVMANIDLIKLHKREEVEKMKRRFSGWATSVPTGGSATVNTTEAAANIRKSLSGLQYRERRLLIDQGHKLEQSVSEVVATGGGAIAAIWKSHWKQANYDFRPEHKRRAIESTRKPYVVRGNWAMENGLMKLGNGTYIDEITRPSEEPFCRCWYEYIYSIRDLPAEMVTAKGRRALEDFKRKRA